jgi:glycosyltransferase involved in cell wall biosynthesis
MAGALLFDGEIRDRERQKSARKEIPVSGFDVFVPSFAKALLTQSRRTPVYLTSEAAALSFQRNAPPWLDMSKDNIRLISAYDPAALKKCDDLVLLSVGPEMLNFAWIRSQMRKPGWPIVAVMHALSPPPRIRYFLTNSLFNRLHRHDALVCATQAAKKAVEGLFLAVPKEARLVENIPFEIPVIPFGVDTQEFSRKSKDAARQELGIAPEELVILYFGKFSPTEKCDLLPLIIAYSQLDRSQAMRLVLAGDDTQFRMAAALKEAAQELGCGDSVQVLPDVSKESKLDIFAAADIFVSPSENVQESFSIPIAEAMASGLPIIASHWAGHDELVEHGKTGFLAPTYLAPITRPLQFITLYSGIYPEKLIGLSTSVDINSLTTHLQILLGDAELRRTMGDEARRRARERLDWKAVIGQYDDLWDELSKRAKYSEAQIDSFECSSFQEVFRHYPSDSLLPWNIVQLNERLSDRRAKILTALGVGQYFDAAIFKRIVEALETRGPMTISELVDYASDVNEEGETAVERHIGRLFKYGLIQLSM